jgi:hypothetical protein
MTSSDFSPVSSVTPVSHAQPRDRLAESPANPTKPDRNRNPSFMKPHSPRELGI